MRPLTSLPSSLLLLLTTLTPDPTHASSPSELKIEITNAVTCKRPTQPGDTISVHYRGTLASTGAVFDESYKRGQPISFVLGSGRVIAGWDQGLQNMCPGEGRKLTIPSELAYGERGAPPVIPPGATLVFETVLVGIAGVELEVTTTSVVEPEETKTETEEGLKIATVPAWVASVTVETPAASPTNEENTNNDTPAKENEEEEEAKEQTQPIPTLATEPLVPHPTASTASAPHTQTQEGECHLLGPFALLVQGALGAVALLSLVYKRWRETPKRPWKIFFFDVSKQVVGSCLTHVLNLAMSMLGSVELVNTAKQAAVKAASAAEGGKGGGKDGGGGGGRSVPNPCSFYLLNLGIDTTIGIPVLYLLLLILHRAFLLTPLARPPASIKSGHYGTPPRTTWWLKQSLIYFIGLTGMKLFVLSLFLLLPWLPWVGDWALRWTEGNEALQVVFAMFVFPLAMNAVQYWVIDNFIMEKRAKDEGGVYQAVQGEEDDDDEEDVTVDGESAPGKDSEDDVIVQHEALKEANPTPIPSYDDRSPPEGSRSRGESPSKKI